jgi:hypothetical protein
MNLDEVTAAWRSEDLSPLYGVDQTLLHQTLRQERAKLEKQNRWMMWGGYAGSAVLLINTGIFLPILFEAHYDATRVVWDYVVGGLGLAAAVAVAWSIIALRRLQRAREQGFGDSLRDQLRRKLAQFDDEATVERRLGLVALVGGLIDVWAIPVASRRIAHVPVPYSDFYWSPLPVVVIFVVVYLSSLWSASRMRERHASRRRQLEALLRELDGQ